MKFITFYEKFHLKNIYFKMYGILTSILSFVNKSWTIEVLPFLHAEYNAVWFNDICLNFIMRKYNKISLNKIIILKLYELLLKKNSIMKKKEKYD